mgnify:CR=1 FL=1
MGGKKIRAKRLKIRSVNGHGELPLPTLAQFQSEDPHNEAIMAGLSAGVRTGKYCRTSEGRGGPWTSKSGVSRRFIKEMDKLVEKVFARLLQTITRNCGRWYGAR